MDRALFDRERQAVQAELEAQGQHIDIPDPNDPQYFGVFLALQRSHPRLAARLQQAEQADPAEILDPFTPKASKTTLKHRLNAWMDQTFMRRGIDGTKVMDRQRVLRTALYSVGGVVTAGLIWSVVAPKPTPAPPNGNTTATSSTSQTNEGAYQAAETTQNTPSTPTTQLNTPSNDPDIFPTAKATDAPPSPISTTQAAPAASRNTPPPPAVFTQVPTSEPVSSTPFIASAPAPAPASPVNTPAFGGDRVVDATPVPISTNASPVLVPAPISTPPDTQRVSPSPAPVKVAPVTKGTAAVQSPFAQTPAPSQPTTPAPSTPPEIAAPFGGELATEPPTSAPPSEPSGEARGHSALMYQAAATPPVEAGSTLIYQQPKAAAENARGSALVYQAGTRGSGPSTGTSLVYQSRPTSSANAPSGSTGSEVTATATPDPEAPSFNTAAVIPGKLFTALRTAAGINAPAIVKSAEGHWIGVATYNTAFGRVDMRFSSFVSDKNGKVYPVQASAYQLSGGALTPGVSCNVHPIAPTLALDLARAGLNSLSTYTQALQNAGTTTVNGALITTTKQPPALVQVVRGELGKVFALPEGNQSINIVADVNAGTEVQILYGITNSDPSGQ